GQDFAERMNLEPRRMPGLDRLFQRSAEPRNLRRSGVRAVGARPGVPELRAEAAQIVALPVGPMIEARHVDVLAADAAIVSRRGALEHRKEPGHVQADLLAQIPADDVGSVPETVRMAIGGRVEQEACRVDATRADDDHLAERLTFLPALP